MGDCLTETSDLRHLVPKMSLVVRAGRTLLSWRSVGLGGGGEMEVPSKLGVGQARREEGRTGLLGGTCRWIGHVGRCYQPSHVFPHRKKTDRF